MRLILMALLTVVFGADPAASAAQQALTITRDGAVSGVELGTYTLITASPDTDRREADRILDVKVSWPRAMQSRDERLFNRILSDSFTFRAHGEVQDKQAYIRDRMSRREDVGSATYNNVVLQIFGSTAVLTYNVALVTKTDRARETWHGTWTDVFLREADGWRIGASYLINERVERATPRR